MLLFFHGHLLRLCVVVQLASYTKLCISQQLVPNGQPLPNGECWVDWSDWVVRLYKLLKSLPVCIFGFGLCGWRWFSGLLLLLLGSVILFSASERNVMSYKLERTCSKFGDGTCLSQIAASTLDLVLIWWQIVNAMFDVKMSATCPRWRVQNAGVSFFLQLM